LLFVLVGIIQLRVIAAEVKNPARQESSLACPNGMEQEENLTAIEKIRFFLLKQDYQGALNLMPQWENEELRVKSREEFGEEYLSLLCYLYIALDKDKVALQKLKNTNCYKINTKAPTLRQKL
jgi:hypothetical protein